MEEPSRRAAATRTVSLSMQRPMVGMGSACNQAPDSLQVAAKSWAQACALGASWIRSSTMDDTMRLSQFFCLSWSEPCGGVRLRNLRLLDHALRASDQCGIEEE